MTNTIKGKPSVYVKELSMPNGSRKYKRLSDRIEYLRKLTLVFRLLHHHAVMESISTNIEGRALELAGPQIHLFNSNKLASASKSALKAILPVLSAYLRDKGELSSMTLEVRIYKTVLDLFPICERKVNTITDERNSRMTEKNLFRVTYDDIYHKVGQTIHAESTAVLMIGKFRLILLDLDMF